MKIEDMNQKLLFLNRRGSMLTLDLGDDVIIRTLVDSYIVTRVEGDVFWLLWKALGYTEGQQHVHTSKIVEHAADDSIDSEHDGEQWIILDMIDDQGNKYHIEMIAPGQEPELVDTWNRWKKYRNDNKDLLLQADKRLLEEHTQIAKDWK
jgi:hypothetical protein